MSRIGKILVSLPKEVKITINPSTVHLEGAKGKLDLSLPRGISIEQIEGQLKVSRKGDTKQDRANHGMIRAHLVNMIDGVSKGHKKELEIQGVGFRATLQGAKILLNVGLSHPVEFPVPGNVKISVPTQTSIIIEGSDICSVGQAAATLRAIKPAEPYKGKGIRYVGEVVRRKQGKAVTK